MAARSALNLLLTIRSDMLCWKEAKHIWLANILSMLKMRMCAWFIKEPEFLGDTLLSDAISDHSTISPALSNAKLLTHFSNQAQAVRNHLPSKIWEERR